MLATGVGSDVGIWEEAQNASKWYRVGEHEALEMPVRAFSFHNYTKVRFFYFTEVFFFGGGRGRLMVDGGFRLRISRIFKIGWLDRCRSLL